MVDFFKYEMTEDVCNYATRKTINPSSALALLDSLSPSLSISLFQFVSFPLTFSQSFSFSESIPFPPFCLYHLHCCHCCVCFHPMEASLAAPLSISPTVFIVISLIHEITTHVHLSWNLYENEYKQWNIANSSLVVCFYSCDIF